MKKLNQQITLTKVMVSYCKLVEPSPKMSGVGMEYSTQIVISKDHPDLPAIKSAIGSMLKEGFPDENMAMLKKGLRDADAEGQAAKNAYMENTMFINAKRPESFGPVKIYSSQGKPILEPTKDMLFSGCIVNVVLKLYTYDTSGNKGVGAGIEGVQIVDNINVQRLDNTADLDAAFKPIDGAADSSIQVSSQEPLDGQASAAPTPQKAETSGEEIPW